MMTKFLIRGTDLFTYGQAHRMAGNTLHKKFMKPVEKMNVDEMQDYFTSKEHEVSPIATCYALSCELLVKAVHNLEKQKKHKFEHNLVVLLDNLGDPIKSGICADVDAKDTRGNFYERLGPVSDAFDAWRYPESTWNDKRVLTKKLDITLLKAFSFVLEKRAIKLIGQHAVHTP